MILGGLSMATPVLIARATTPRAVDVEIRALSFQQADVTVSVGTTIRWVNRDLVPHTTTSLEDVWDSSLIQPGETFEFTFEEEGEYAYFCVPHPFMKASVRVIDEPRAGAR